MGITIGDAGGGSVAVIESTLPDIPATLPEELWVIKDSNGSIVSAGFQGVTQKHPNPFAGGNRISLATNKIANSPVGGYNVILGAGVVQTVNGLEVTLNAGNPDIIIDLPIFGSGTFWETLLEFDITNGTPAVGNRVGIELDNNSTPYQRGASLFYDTADWFATVQKSGSFFPSTQPITLIQAESIRLLSVPVLAASRYAWAAAGLLDTPQSISSKFLSDAWGETLGTTTWDLRLTAHWSGGADLVVIFKSVSANIDPLQISAAP